MKIWQVDYDTAALGDPDSALGGGDHVFGNCAYFRRKAEAEAFVRECAQAWLDNPPGFGSEEEREEYMADDYRAYYNISETTVSEIVKDWDDPDEIMDLLRVLDL